MTQFEIYVYIHNFFFNVRWPKLTEKKWALVSVWCQGFPTFVALNTTWSEGISSHLKTKLQLCVKMLLAVVLASALFLCTSARPGCFTSLTFLTGIKNVEYLINNLQVRCKGRVPVGKAANRKLKRNIRGWKTHHSSWVLISLLFRETHLHNATVAPM